jgi:protease-4
MKQLIWIATSLLLLGESRAVEAPTTYDMSLPYVSPANCQGPLCILVNPAAIEREGQWLYLHAENRALDGRPSGRADGLLFSMGGFGLGLQYLRPDEDRSKFNYLKLNLSLPPLNIGRDLALTAGLEILDPTQTRTDSSFDIMAGASYRPCRYLSLGLVGRNLGRAGLAHQVIRPSLEMGLAVRPLWMDPERLTLSANAVLLDDRDDPAIRFSSQTKIADGINLFANVDLDGNFGFGLNIDMLNMGLGSYMAFRNGASTQNQGIVMMVQKTFGDQPGLPIERMKTVELILNEKISDNDNPEATLLTRPLTYFDVEQAIRRAGSDPRIDSLMIKIQNAKLNISRVQELRLAIENFKQQGKKVFFLLMQANNLTYYLATKGDAIYLHPNGNYTVIGLSLSALFIKGSLEKIGIFPEAARAGKYKSAVEMFTRKKPTAAHLEVLNSMADDIADQMLKDIAKDRGLTRKQLKKNIDNGYMTAKEALAEGMIDGLALDDQWDEKIANRLGHAISKFTAYPTLAPTSNRWGTLPCIAVVHAQGSIGILPASGMKVPEVIQALRYIRDDTSIKAVVLRVNSPGGDSFLGDMIRHQVQKLSQQKPVIVSMGPTAASAGYSISSPATSILASPATITGSIGVLSILYDGSELYQKLGIAQTTVARGNLARLFSSFRRKTQEEMELIQHHVDAVYQEFVRKVAQARKNLDEKQVHNIAQGRVWTGRQAFKNGLVDELGGLYKAIERAKEKCGLLPDAKVRLVHLPQKSLSLSGVLTDLGLWNKESAGVGIWQETLKNMELLLGIFNKDMLAILPFFDLTIR